jgi:hypothetical protein
LHHKTEAEQEKPLGGIEDNIDYSRRGTLEFNDRPTEITLSPSKHLNQISGWTSQGGLFIEGN